VVSEQELSGPSAAGVWHRSPVAAEDDDAVDQVEALCVDGHHPFGVEFAVGDLQPAAMIGNLVDAVQLEIEQFPDPQPAGSLRPERAGGPTRSRAAGSVPRSGDGRRRPASSGAAPAEAWGCRRGTPACGVVFRPAHSVMSVRNPVNASTRRDWSATVINSPFFGLTASTRRQVGLDVAAALQRGDRPKPGIYVGQEHPEVGEPGGDRRPRLGLASRSLASR
jgi:hypothetical protein